MLSGSLRDCNAVLSDCFLDVIGEGVSEADPWGAALALLCRHAGFAYTNLCQFDPMQRRATLQGLVGVDHAKEQHLARFYAAEIPEIIEALEAGALELEEPRIAPASSRASANAYRAEMGSRGLSEIVTLCLGYEPDRLTLLLLARETTAAGTLSGDERSLITLLVPSIRRAVKMWDRLRAMRRQIAALTREIDSLAFGSVCIDTGGLILSANATAQRMLASGDLLRNSGGRLHGASRPVTELLLEAARSVAGSATAASVDIALRGARESTVARVMGLPDDAGAPRAAALAVVFIADPSLTSAAGMNAFGRLYDLTCAEKVVLQHLAAGRSPDEIAAQLRISVATVRTHLARLFAKTKTTGQVALIARVHQMCLPIL